ncbi:TlpA family protein disulfide reductase [Hydrogenimonas sp.]
MHLKLLPLGALIAITLLTNGCQSKEKSEKPAAQKSEKEIKEPKKFTLKDANATIVAQLGEKGITFTTKAPIVMLDFFATWCPPCRAEIPHLANLQKKYKGKLQIIGVLVDNVAPDELSRFRKEHGINYFVSNAPDNMLLAASTADMLHQPKNFSIPMMVIFVNGKYFRHYVGMVPEEMMESDIKEVLKEIE